MLDNSPFANDSEARISLQSDNRNEIRRLLVGLSKAAGVLPTSIFLGDVECRGTDRETIAGGGFADIFRATYRGQKVALKRLRVFSSAKEVGSYNAVSRTYQELGITLMTYWNVEFLSRSVSMETTTSPIRTSIFGRG